MTPHAKRWLTAIVALPVIYWVIAFGGKSVFFVFIAAVSLTAIYEYNRMAFGKGFYLEKVLIVVSALFLLSFAFTRNSEFMLATIIFSVMTAFIFNLLRIKKQGHSSNSSSRTVVGIVYVPLLMTYFVFLRDLSAGELWVFYVLVIAFAGDIAGYYTGRFFGGKKLFVEVSPGKTTEGTLGLILGSVLGSVAFIVLFPLCSVGHAVLVGFFAGITGQLGDLVESVMKREAFIKDSGSILPGHGGILDRLDCLLFIVPFVFYYRKFIIQ